MTDQEIAAAAIEALRFPYICKRCGERRKEVDSGGVCAECGRWHASWGTIVYSNSSLLASASYTASAGRWTFTGSVRTTP